MGGVVMWKTVGFQAAAVAAVVAIVVLLGRVGGNDSVPQPASQSVSSVQESTGPLWSPGPDHDAGENAAHHWQKHGGEFPELHSEADYIAAAHRFVSRPPPGALTKVDSRGDTLIYDPQTNTFAVRAPDGAPRTMFRPDSGRAYWERQQ
jgi:pyocin large subunit-like protein